MPTCPDLRRAICHVPLHCWLRLRRHRWVEYTLEYRGEGQAMGEAELHRVCVDCRLTQVRVGPFWLKCVSCRSM